MEIAGLTPFTTTDYPEHLACVIWTQGCPARCDYCYNKHLCPLTEGQASWAKISNFLVSRKRVLDAVVFSGGEPLIHKDLAGHLGLCRALGYKVGLHTSGYCAARLEAILGLVDWVGIDYKAPPQDYMHLAGINFTQVETCLDLLVVNNVDFEVRTTVTPYLEQDFARPLGLIEKRMRELGVVDRWKKQPYYEVDNSGNLRHPSGGENPLRSLDPSDGLPSPHLEL